MSALGKTTKAHLDEYLDMCLEFVEFDKEKAKRIVNNLVLEFNKEEYDKNSIIEMTDMEDRWYASIEKDPNNPDYSVYASPYYFCETWLCWKSASSKTLRHMRRADKILGKSIFSDMNPTSIVDLGSGSGYTTAVLCEFYPNATVYGTNFEDSYQYKMSSKLGEKYGFTMTPEVYGKSEMVFASEYFEHILDPISHLKHILKICDPKYFLVANTFTQPAIGHFPKYFHNNIWISGKDISRMFKSTLREHGYKSVATNCWNNRPEYWKKEV